MFCLSVTFSLYSSILPSGFPCRTIRVSSVSSNDFKAGPFKLPLHCGNPVRRRIGAGRLFLSTSWTRWLIGPNYTRRRQSITDFPSFQVTPLFLPFYFCNWRTDYCSCVAHLWAVFLPVKEEISDRILSNTHTISFYSSVSFLYSFFFYKTFRAHSNRQRLVRAFWKKKWVQFSVQKSMKHSAIFSSKMQSCMQPFHSPMIKSEYNFPYKNQWNIPQYSQARCKVACNPSTVLWLKVSTIFRTKINETFRNILKQDAKLRATLPQSYN